MLRENKEILKKLSKEDRRESPAKQYACTQADVLNDKGVLIDLAKSFEIFQNFEFCSGIQRTDFLGGRAPSRLLNAITQDGQRKRLLDNVNRDVRILDIANFSGPRPLKYFLINS